MKIAVIGATGLVGKTLLEVLPRYFEESKVRLYAQREHDCFSIGEGKTVRVEALSKEILLKNPPDLAFLVAGGAVAAEYAPFLVSIGAVVVDNSSRFRQDPTVPLVVREVNPEAATHHNGIVANPNCSTIQAVVALSPLAKRYGLQAVSYHTYQAVSGAGRQALHELSTGIEPSAIPYPIRGNVVPQIDVFTPDGYTEEEHKMIRETKRILNAPNLAVSATCVRVPVTVGHCVSIEATFATQVDVDEVRGILGSAEGVVLWDDPNSKRYPMPILAAGRDGVWVGRIRKGASPNQLLLWVVADNLRKGAAVNALQVAHYLWERGYLPT